MVLLLKTLQYLPITVREEEEKPLHVTVPSQASPDHSLGAPTQNLLLFPKRDIAVFSL